MCQTKQRWSRTLKGSPKEQEEEWLKGECFNTINDLETIAEHQNRETFDPDTNIVDWRKHKATDMRNNPKVYLPKARPVQEELELGAKEFIYTKTIQKYIDANCNDQGTQKQDNLTKSERRGIAKLRKKQELGQIIITTTDKSGQLCIIARDN